MSHIILYIKEKLSTALCVVALAMLFAACSDSVEQDDPYADMPLEVGVSTSWKCGRSIGQTRALVDPLDNTDPNIYNIDAYPQRFIVNVSTKPGSAATSPNPQTFIINRTPTTNDYYSQKYIEYHTYYSQNLEKYTSCPYPKQKAQKYVLEAGTMVATGCDYTINTIKSISSVNLNGNIPNLWTVDDIKTFNNNDFLTSGGCEENVKDEKYGGSYHIERNHLFFDLGHATAMLRLYFQVSEHYSQIRYIVLREVKLARKEDVMSGLTIDASSENFLTINSEDNTNFSKIDGQPGIKLTEDPQLVACSYINPSYNYDGTKLLEDCYAPVSWTGGIANNTPLVFLCKYDIYDKDEPLDNPDADYTNHRTREAVIATNITTLKMALNGDPSAIGTTKICAGHYYDLRITIDPDYLYVLSEHDNKQHLTVQ